MKTRNEREIYIGKYEFVRIVKGFFEFFFGFLLSAISLGGMFPFGLAYSSISGNFGVMGGLVGYFIFSSDSYRYVFACIFCFLLKKLLEKKIPVNGISGTFFYVVWGTLLAEILGIITAKYTFTENMLFALSGIIAGIGGVVYYHGNIKVQRHTSHRDNIAFFSKSVFVASVLSGLAHVENFGLYGAYVLTVLSVFAVGRYGGMLKGFTLGLIIDIFYIISGLFTWTTLGSVAACAVIGGLLRDLPRYFTVAATSLSSLLILIYQQGSLNSWTNLLCVIMGGAIYITLPYSLLGIVYDKVFFSHMGQKVKKGTKIKARKTYIGNTGADPNPVCAGCNKKLICWVRDHDYTADVFLKLKNNGFTRVPSHFEERCDRIGELINVLSKPKDSNVCQKLLISKGACTKKGEKASGDNAVTFITKDNKHVICLLDGMGSGVRASKQSSECGLVLRKLIESGVDKKEAVHFLNERLSEDKYESILGVDLTIVDLDGGYIETYKAGVSPTYIIRNGKIYEFGVSSLPIGVLDEVHGEVNRCRIRPDDIIVMVSDGFLEKGAQWLGGRLSSYASDGRLSCSDITEMLIEDGCQAGLDGYDDLTVVAAKIL